MITITYEDDSGAVVSIKFDVDTQETHELANIITEHPVEKGADISDNIQPQLDQFTIEGYVSDAPTFSNPGIVDVATFSGVELQISAHPLPQQFTAAAAVGALGNLVFGGGGNPTATMMTFDELPSRKKALYDLLRDVRDNARVCRVITAMHEYEDMVLQSLTSTRTPEAGSGAVFSVVMKQIRFVTSDVTVAPEPTEKLGAAPVSVGSKNADEDKLAEKKKSLAAKIFDAGTSALGF
jgi:hypothetical protein